MRYREILILIAWRRLAIPVELRFHLHSLFMILRNGIIYSPTDLVHIFFQMLVGIDAVDGEVRRPDLVDHLAPFILHHI